jgi:aminoglycoside phosphotransferase (APT) family kinase protein
MTDEKFAQLVQKIDPHSTLLRTQVLMGGISAQVTALEVRRADGQTTKMIVRQHGPGDLADNPQIAADELRLLNILHAEGLPTPQPYYVDASGDLFETPVIVMEYIEGSTEFAPASISDVVRQMAAQLVRIHAIDSITHHLSFLPQQEQRYADNLRNRPTKLDESLDEGRIRDILEAAWPLPRHNVPVLLHGDYWPGNILWQEGQFAAVIDWEDAAVGDPSADVGNARMEILWSFGVEAMQQFTEHYRALNPINFANLPYWDLCAALRPASKIGEWAGDAIKEAHMRKCHRLFITQAYETLSNA